MALDFQTLTSSNQCLMWLHPRRPRGRLRGRGKVIISPKGIFFTYHFQPMAFSVKFCKRTIFSKLIRNYILKMMSFVNSFVTFSFFLFCSLFSAFGFKYEIIWFLFLPLSFSTHLKTQISTDRRSRRNKRAYFHKW